MKFLLIMNMVFTFLIFIRLVRANKLIASISSSNQIFNNDWLSYKYATDGTFQSGKAFTKEFGDENLTVINLYDKNSECVSIEFLRVINKTNDKIDQMLSLHSDAKKYIEDMRVINNSASASKKNSLTY